VLLAQFLIRADKRRLLVLTMVVMVESAARVSFAVWFKVLFTGIVGAMLGHVLVGAAGYAVTLGLVGVLNMVRVTTIGFLQEELSLAVDQEVMRCNVTPPSLAFVESRAIRDHLDVLGEDRGKVPAALSSAVGVLQVGFTLALVLCVLGAVNPLLLLLPLAAVPSVVLTRQGERLRDRSADSTAQAIRVSRQLFGLAVSPAAGRELRLFGLTDQFRYDYSHHWSRYVKIAGHASLQETVLSLGGLLAFFAGYGLALLTVVHDAIINPSDTAVGNLVLVLTLATQVNQLVGATVVSVGSLSAATAVFRRLARLSVAVGLSHEHTVRPSGRWTRLPSQLLQGLVLDDVSLTYPDTARPALSHVSVTLPAGSTVAIVGENGAGKSSLVKLLAGLYRPSSGRLLVDGVDLTEWPVEEWWERLSGVFQDFLRPEFTARQAIGLGDTEHLSDNAVWSAVRRAGVDSLAEAMPRGLDTQFGSVLPGGRELSGGQWQQVAIARSKMRRTPILQLLDEPDASLDAERQRAVLDAQLVAARDSRVRVGGITVVVSHRLSTTRDADLIIVLHRGQLVEQGDHEQLVSRGGRYAEMFELQAKGYR